MNDIDFSKHFIIRFTTKKSQHFGRYFRKIVKAGNLERYIGLNNAINALQTIKKFNGDKLTLKYRKRGRIEVWSK
jgi:hypothetical protein